MAHVRLTVDDRVEYDGDLGEWVATPPSVFRDRLNPNTTPEEWVKAAMLSVAEAIMRNRPVDIVVQTGNPWTMTVAHGN